MVRLNISKLAVQSVEKRRVFGYIWWDAVAVVALCIYVENGQIDGEFRSLGVRVYQKSRSIIYYTGTEPKKKTRLSVQAS